MSNKIKIIGLKNLPTDDIIKPDKDYAITLIGSLDGIFERAEESCEISKTYHIRAERVEQIIPIGEKEIKFEQGTTPSQRLRFALKDWLKRCGKPDTQENYELAMKKIIENINGKDL